MRADIRGRHVPCTGTPGPWIASGCTRGDAGRFSSSVCGLGVKNRFRAPHRVVLSGLQRREDAVRADIRGRQVPCTGAPRPCIANGCTREDADGLSKQLDVWSRGKGLRLRALHRRCFRAYKDAKMRCVRTSEDARSLAQARPGHVSPMVALVEVPARCLVSG